MIVHGLTQSASGLPERAGSPPETNAIRITDVQELYGTPSQIDLMKRGVELWALLRDDPRYSYYGRMVSLCDPDTRALERTIALTRLQGAGSCQYFPSDWADAFCAEIETSGLRASRYEQYRGEASCLATSNRVLNASPVPDGITIQSVDADTPPAQVEAVARLLIDCGVMPVPGPVMRGYRIDGICLMAIDPDGTPIATASSYMCNSPASPRANDAFLGMLTTREDWRGKGIARYLSAAAIVHMSRTYGAQSFNIGIRSDNPASMWLCETLGIVATPWTAVGCMDPEVFGPDAIKR